MYSIFCFHFLYLVEKLKSKSLLDNVATRLFDSTVNGLSEVDLVEMLVTVVRQNSY